jgi:L-amino acid N-acyltransferase YncA
MAKTMEQLFQDYPKEVTLRDGRTIRLRPLDKGDFDSLYDFFQELSDEDRLFLRNNVKDPNLIRRWTEKIDFERVIPLVAEDGGRIVADGTLHFRTHGWMQHVGLIGLVVARSHRRSGLGTLTARELVGLAEQRSLERVQAFVIEDDLGTVKMFETVGFNKAAVVKNMVKDQRGNKRNLAIMCNDVANLSRAMEDWIHDSMLPAFRVPGAGA